MKGLDRSNCLDRSHTWFYPFLYRILVVISCVVFHIIIFVKFSEGAAINRAMPRAI